MGIAHTNFKRQITQIINYIEEYGLFSESENKKDTIILSPGKEDYIAFKTEFNKKTYYNIFIGNIHIKLEENEDEQVFTMYIKKEDEKWEFNFNSHINNIDWSHPINYTYRIYIWYDVPVLDVTRSSGELYEHGNWDRYVYKTFNKLTEKVQSKTDMAQFNSNYKNL